jgi:TldD protein
MRQFQGKTLLGSYAFDSEGVKAQEVTLVDSGTLQSYLVGRQPLRDFPSSNGHGRAAPGTSPQPAVGTFIVKSSEPESADSLKQKLIQMASEQNKPYAYRVDTLGPGNSPRLLYRVYVKDGHEELVRGAVFNELDVRALRNDFEELEVKRADTSKDKLPEYPAPGLKN